MKGRGGSKAKKRTLGQKGVKIIEAERKKKNQNT